MKTAMVILAILIPAILVWACLWISKLERLLEDLEEGS
jgi:hypothetical protein